MGAFPHIRHAARSDIGRRRTNNEDAFGAFPSSGIYCVADGMGGGDDGEVASAATVEAVGRFAKECPIPEKFTYPIDGIVSGVRKAVDSASAWIAARTRQKGLKGCGSTFVGICFDAARPDAAIALHAGDSRLYRIRGRSIEQITVDHSAAGLIGAKDDREVNPMFRGMILRAVGIQPSVELERTEVPLRARDRILICSDGLSRMVGDRKMLSIIRACKDLEAAADALVAAANDAGGEDNITVVLIEVGELPPPLPTSPLADAAADTVLETGSAPTDGAGTRRTNGAGVSCDTTAGDDFIPSTAGDGAPESTEEKLDIPESDTEDDASDENPAPEPGAATHARRLAEGFGRRSAAKRLVAACSVLALILLCAAISCARLRNGDGDAEKDTAEAKMPVDERREPVQTAEKARRAAERREREERAAREMAEADALREKESKAQEAARQEELRRAEELRKMQELEEAEARQSEAIDAFRSIVEDGAAAKFNASVKRLVPDCVPSNLYQKLSRAGNPRLPREELVAAIVALTEDVQRMSRGLRAVAGDGAGEFDREAGDFIGRDASDPETQMECVRIIRSVPKWFGS